MATIRRYGPSMVVPGVSPRPELGNGGARMAGVFRQAFDDVNAFIRPAVEQVQTARGERDALADLGAERPEGGLVGTRASLREGTGAVEGQAAPEDQELEEHNRRSFEMRLPFTVRDQAYNATAERVITARTDSLFTEMMSQAQRQATSMEDLNARMAQVREEVMGQIPTTLNGLRTSVQLAWEGGVEQARRQRIAAAAAAAAARTRAARSETLAAAQAETERLIATGAGAEAISEHLAATTERLAQYGPRGAFTIGGVEFPADPTRAGIMTPEAIADTMEGAQREAQELMVEADFLRTDAPGAYVQEFEQQIFSGNSPFPLGESLDMLRTMRGQAYTRESRREAAAQEALGQLDRMVDEGVQTFMDLTEAGVPATMPEDDRAAMLEALTPYPARQREAREQFAVMDAAAETFGMNGPQLRGYVEEMRGRVMERAEAGEIDVEGVAVIHSLQDRLDELTDSITAESIGLPAIESQTTRGRLVDDVDYDGLREQAAGNADLVNRIAEVEAIHRGAEEMMAAGLTAQQREDLIEANRAARATLAGDARGMGEEAVAAMRVMDGLEQWSQSLTDMASDDPTAFAAAVGIALPGFEGVETMAQAGQVIAQRVQALDARARAEGVENVVPLTQAEISDITVLLQESTAGDRVRFVSEVFRAGDENAVAIFEAIGQQAPAIGRAGAVAAMGNMDAASIILRAADAGGVDFNHESREYTNLRDAAIALGSELTMPLADLGLIRDIHLERIDETAMAYARGAALAQGTRTVTDEMISTGYAIALGRQPDGTGGPQDLGRFGVTILPPGFTGRATERALRQMRDADLIAASGSLAYSRDGVELSRPEFREAIAGLLPSPSEPSTTLVPVDLNGDYFLTADGLPLQINIDTLINGAVARDAAANNLELGGVE